MKSHITIFITKICVVLLLSFLFSCTKATESTPTWIISGTVTLVNDTGNANKTPHNNAGITVCVYQLAELDSTLVRLNLQNPSIGTVINQKTEFDHRLQAPVSYTVTDSSGHFEIANIPNGEYNIVIFKEGWGMRYILNHQASESSPLEVELFPETTLSGVIDSNVILKSFHNYIVTEHVTLLNNASIVFEGNSLLRINPGKNIDVYGEIAFNGSAESPIIITSNDKLNTITKYEPGNIAYFGRVRVCTEGNINNNIISNIILSFSLNGISNYVNGVLFSKNFSKHSQHAYTAESVNNSSTENCTFNKVDKPIRYNFAPSKNSYIQKNNIINCQTGIILENQSSPQISNNFILNSETGIYSYNICESKINNNLISSLTIGIAVVGQCNENIEFNTIYSEKCIDIPAHGSLFDSVAQITNNNLKCSTFYIYLGLKNSLNINATNNYYFDTNLPTILNSIFDRSDMVPSDPYYYETGFVNVEPIKQDFISTALPIR